jgi:mannose-6-phosphate isomerase-like protein (cupin superfamily)
MQPVQIMPQQPVTTLDEVDAIRRKNGALYHEFLRVRDMSAGLYVLEAGGVDPQAPHAEDEMYYVVAGRGKIAIEGVDYDVDSGSTIFVPALAEHRFHTITERLRILVIFAPAETAS